MSYQASNIKTGLYLVATPIGTASDISLTALNLLASANVLVAEDKRNLLKLMNLHSIKLARRPLLSYHDHNGKEQRPRILSFLKEDKSVVFVSDAGTPLIADPGYRLVAEALSNGCRVSCAPGASAVLAALMVSGLPTDKFFFGGFIPPKTEAKKIFFEKYLYLPATLVFFESALRLNKTLTDLSLVCEKNRQVVVCRELTKKFEDVRRGTLEEVSEYFSVLKKLRGELVLLLSPWKQIAPGYKEIDEILVDAMDYMSFKNAVSFVSVRLKVSKKIVYSRALNIKNLI